jgi:hypothetical protein
MISNIVTKPPASAANPNPTAEISLSVPQLQEMMESWLPKFYNAPQSQEARSRVHLKHTQSSFQVLLLAVLMPECMAKERWCIYVIYPSTCVEKYTFILLTRWPVRSVPEDHKRYASLGVNLLVNSNSTFGVAPANYLAFGSHIIGIYSIHMSSSPIKSLLKTKLPTGVDSRSAFSTNRTSVKVHSNSKLGNYVYLFYSTETAVLLTKTLIVLFLASRGLSSFFHYISSTHRIDSDLDQFS